MHFETQFAMHVACIIWQSLLEPNGHMLPIMRQEYINNKLLVMQ